MWAGALTASELAAFLCSPVTADSGGPTAILRFFFLRFSGPSSFVGAAGGGTPIGRNLPIFFAFSSFSTSSVDDANEMEEPFFAASRRRFKSAILSSRVRLGLAVEVEGVAVCASEEGPEVVVGNGLPDNAASRAASAPASSSAVARALFCSKRAKSSPAKQGGWAYHFIGVQVYLLLEYYGLHLPQGISFARLSG